MNEKLIPHDSELEKIVLGSLIMKQDILIDVCDILSPDCFYSNPNKIIFESILDLWNNEKTVDLVTLVQDLRSRKKLDYVGGAFYISNLTQRVASTKNIIQHSIILKQKEVARKQIILGNELVNMGYDSSIDPLETNEFIADAAFKLNNLIETNKDHTNNDLIAEVQRKIEAAAKSSGITGIKTGFAETDRLFGGYQDATLIIKAARPAMGKTAHALCEGLNASIIHGKKVLFFSLEMGANELMQRLITIQTGIESDKIRTGRFSDEDWDIFQKGVRPISESNFKIVDDVYTLSGIRNKAKKEVLKNGVDIIFVDYLQLIINKIKGGNREQEISSIARGLKMLSKELNVPVVALSQLSRLVEQRADKKPQLSDLRESGAIEQDADIVTFLYRPEYYNILEFADGSSTVGKGYLLVAKHRAGALKDIEMSWIPKITKFTDDYIEEAKPVIEQFDPAAGMKPNEEFDDPF